MCIRRSAPEADVAVKQIAELQRRGITPRTVGADRGYCSRPFVEGLRGHRVVPHPAPLKDRRLLGVRVRSKAHQLSQKSRRKIEEIFGWAKTIGCFRKSRYLGVERTLAAAQYVVAACDLVRMARLSLWPPKLARADARRDRGDVGRHANPAKRSASARAGAPFTAPTAVNPLAVLILIQPTWSEAKLVRSSTAC